MSLPTETEIMALHRKYAPNDTVCELITTHCKIVNEIAQQCAARSSEQIDTELLQAACLLHDIGTYAFFDAQAHGLNNRMYPQHGMLGAKIVADEGLDPRLADLIETHLLMGLSKDEILHTKRPHDVDWPLPARDYIPTTIEGVLLCYADRFHSKHPTFNRYETFLAGLERYMPLQAEKFKQSAERFGLPDIEALAKRYGHPIAQAFDLKAPKS